jgi:DNA-directed RNA polymerase subunit RPC12/RpoP
MNPIWQSVMSFLIERHRHCPNCHRRLLKPSDEKSKDASCPYCGARLKEDRQSK